MITDARAAGPEIDFSTFPEADGKPMAAEMARLRERLARLSLDEGDAPHDAGDSH